MLKWLKRGRVATGTDVANVSDEVAQGRRTFFKAGAGALAGGAALASGTARAATAEIEAPSADGYRETDHVRSYYDSARM